MLNILPDRLQINQVVPLSEARCRVEFYYLYDRGLKDAANFAYQDQRFSDEVQKEDIAICEHLQRSVDSGMYECGPLHPDFEKGVIHFHSLWQQHMNRV